MTVAHQATQSMEFSSQEYWSGLPFPSPGDLPNPGIETRSPHCRQTFYHLSHQGSILLSKIELIEINIEGYWDNPSLFENQVTHLK